MGRSCLLCRKDVGGRKEVCVCMCGCVCACVGMYVGYVLWKKNFGCILLYVCSIYASSIYCCTLNARWTVRGVLFPRWLCSSSWLFMCLPVLDTPIGAVLGCITCSNYSHGFPRKAVPHMGVAELPRFPLYAYCKGRRLLQ